MATNKSIGKKRVKLGPNANVFHDQTTGITISKGESIELNMYQLNSKRIKNALAGGHLIYSNEELDNFNKQEEKEQLIEKLKLKSVKLFEKGTDPTKAAEGFTLDELKLLASEHEIEVDDNDTKVSIMKAIFEDISSGDGK